MLHMLKRRPFTSAEAEEGPLRCQIANRLVDGTARILPHPGDLPKPYANHDFGLSFRRYSPVPHHHKTPPHSSPTILLPVVGNLWLPNFTAPTSPLPLKNNLDPSNLAEGYANHQSGLSSSLPISVYGFTAIDRRRLSQGS